MSRNHTTCHLHPHPHPRPHTTRSGSVDVPQASTHVPCPQTIAQRTAPRPAGAAPGMPVPLPRLWWTPPHTPHTTHPHTAPRNTTADHARSTAHDTRRHAARCENGAGAPLPTRSGRQAPPPAPATHTRAVSAPYVQLMSGDGVVTHCAHDTRRVDRGCAAGSLPPCGGGGAATADMGTGSRKHSTQGSN